MSLLGCLLLLTCVFSCSFLRNCQRSMKYSAPKKGNVCTNSGLISVVLNDTVQLTHTHTHTHTTTTTTTTTSTNKQTNKPLNKPFTSVLHCQKWCRLSICILLAALQMVMLKASQLSRLEPQKVSLITETTDQLWWSVALVGQVREVLQRAAAQWNQESYKASFMNLTPVMKIKVLSGILVLGTYSCQHNLQSTKALWWGTLHRVWNLGMNIFELFQQK